MNTLVRLFGPSMPLLNSANWDSDLHPRDSDGEFRYNGGRHRKSVLRGRSAHPKFKGLIPSSIQNVLALPINQNTRRRNGTAINPFFSHYGYSNDKTSDTNSNDLHLGKFGPLGPASLAISDNVAKANRLVPRKAVYANGKYLGNYDDRAPENNSIDVYDPNNSAGSQNWGGTVKGGVTISSHKK